MVERDLPCYHRWGPLRPKLFKESEKEPLHWCCRYKGHGPPHLCGCGMELRGKISRKPPFLKMKIDKSGRASWHD